MNTKRPKPKPGNLNPLGKPYSKGGKVGQKSKA